MRSFMSVFDRFLQMGRSAIAQAMLQANKVREDPNEKSTWFDPRRHAGNQRCLR